MATADTSPAEPGALPARLRSTPRPPGRPRPAVPEQPQPAATLIGSVQRAVRLLESVAGHPYGAPAKQLARETGLALPTAYHLLRTLVHEGYLRRDKGLFFLGGAAERLASAGAAQKRRSTIADTLAHWRDAIGAPVYYAVYQGGEIEMRCIADAPDAPAVQQWADFRETGHAHAVGQCLLSQLDEDARRDHLRRHPVQTLTRYTVRDSHTLLRRLARARRADPVTEHQEYSLGTVCAAVPITVGATVATVALSLPADQADRLIPAARRLEHEVARRLGSLALSISI